MARFDQDKEKFNTGRLLDGIESDAKYSLEDILNEFGGWSNKKEMDFAAAEPELKEPETEMSPSTESPGMPLFDISDLLQTSDLQPEQSEEKPDPESPKTPSRFRFINLDLSDDSNFSDEISDVNDTVEKPLVWSWQDRDGTDDTDSDLEKISTETQNAPESQESRNRGRKQAKSRNDSVEPMDSEKRQSVSPSAALRHYRNRSAFTRLRLLFVLLLTVSAVVLTLAPVVPIRFFQLIGTAKATPMVLLILMCLCAVVCVDLILRGISQLLSARFGLEFLLTAAFAVCIIDTVGALSQLRVPYCAGVCVGFLFSSWNSYLTCVGNIRSLRVVSDGDGIYAVKVASDAWNGVNCAYKASDSAADFVDLLEAPNRASNAIRIYVPFALSIAVVLSIVCNIRVGVPVIRMLAACMCAALPVSGFVCYSRPFALVATRLSRAGAALCGWSSSKLLSGDLGVVACDHDLYPTGSVSINGVKVYNDFRLEQMICYAATAISKSDSGLKSIFEEFAKEQGIRLSEVGSFRCYEGGGIGAEIRGDIVLVGSVGFMHLMGIRLPTGTNIRQAVYIAVNGMIAGVVAINYDPGTPVISALQCAVRRRGVDIIGATRDFLISPAMLHAKFHIPTTRSAFPPVAERYRLSALSAADAVDYAAVLSRNSLLPFAEAIAGARSLKSSVTAGVAVNLFVGLFGLLMVCFLGFGGAIESASALNMLLFSLIWTLPNLLITTWSNKY